MKDGVYYIENTVDERRVGITGMFPTLEEAKQALKSCSDWFCKKGTGNIYHREFGLDGKITHVYKGNGNPTELSELSDDELRNEFSRRHKKFTFATPLNVDKLKEELLEAKEELHRRGISLNEINY